jgi:molybdopterin molybdotransferase
MAERPADDCFFTDKDRLTHRAALDLITAGVLPLAERERVRLTDALGRVAAERVTAPRPVPGHANAAVDGYAFAFRDYDAALGARLRIAGRSAAGSPFRGTVWPGEAIRIFTGAVMPEGLDSVVMQEDVSLGAEGGAATVRLPKGLRAGANRRKAGEDLAIGDAAVEAGRRLRPQDIAALASIGAATVTCSSRPRVAILSSGDEVVPAGTALRGGEVYDANAPMLEALVRTAGGVPYVLGIVPDDGVAVRRLMERAACEHDLIISSGGASQGEEDHISRTLGQIGRRHLWQIAVKPGRPMLFGQVGRCLFLGLPGNPVAVFVCFLLYARPILARLAGEAWREPVRFRVKAGFEVGRKKADRRELWRGSLEAGPQGPVAIKYPRDGSGLISSLRASDGLIEVAEEVTSVAVGDWVDFIPYSELGIA